MIIIDGKTYKYTNVLPSGDIVHWNGGENITEEQIDNLNEIMSRAWDALPDETKIEINKKMELKYGTLNEGKHCRLQTLSLLEI